MKNCIIHIVFSVCKVFSSSVIYFKFVVINSSIIKLGQCYTMGIGGKCSYVNCVNTPAKNRELSFFKFPVKNRERCTLWIVNSGRDDFIELKESQLKYRTLCSKHFKVSAFTNNLKNKLLQNHPAAVPVPWFESEDEENLHSDYQDITLNDENLNQSSGGGGDISPRDSKCVEETVEQFNEDFQPLPNSPTPRKKKLLKTITKQRAKLKNTKNKLLFCRKRKNIIGLNSLLRSLSNYICGEPLVFIKMQLKHQTRIHWNEEEKNLSLSLYYKSPSVYRFMRDRGYKLPCLTLIRKWVNVNNITPGFNSEVFDKVHAKATTMTATEKQCVLMCDEMSIRKALEYNSILDLVEGFEDLGILGRHEKIASHAMVFMLRGLNNPWKFPIAYVLSNNALKKSSLALLLDVCIEKVMSTSLDLKALVCDLGSTNSAALRLMGVTKDFPYYVYDEKRIYCLFDYPHLLKCIRNTLLKQDVLIGNQIVSWNDIREFFDADRKSVTDCRAAPKLSERHMNPQEFQKMSVKLAAQVFSNSVSRGMKAANNMGLLQSSSSLNTANFVGRINDITDCLNSKHCNEKNPLKQPLSSINNKVKNCLEDAIPYIESWSITKGKNPPCFDGLVQTIRGILYLFEDMSLERKCILLTGRLNQDPVENLFGVLRRRCGHNSNPSAKEFRKNLQHVLSVRLMDPPDTANCEPDGDENLLLETTETTPYLCCTDSASETPSTQLTLLVTSPTGSFLSSDCFPCNTDTTDKTLQLTPLEDNVICYISGWLAKKCIDKFSCDTCSDKLLKPRDSMTIPREQLLFFKSFTRHTGEFANLKQPSDSLYDVVRMQVVCFAEWFPKNISARQIKKTLVTTVTSELEKKFPQWLDSVCREHRLYMLELLVRCKLYYSLRRQSNDIRDKALFKIGLKRKPHQSQAKLNTKLRKLQNV